MQPHGINREDDYQSSFYLFIYLFIYTSLCLFMVILFRPHWLVQILNSKQSYHISTITVLLHIVTTIRFFFIKSPEEGRLDCPKYRENQLARLFFLAVFSL